MFTLYRIVKRSVAESVLDRASVHTRNAAFEAFSAPEQYFSAPLSKVERSVSDRFLKRSETSLNSFIGSEIATEPREAMFTLYQIGFCSVSKVAPMKLMFCCEQKLMFCCGAEIVPKRFQCEQENYPSYNLQRSLLI